MPTRDVVVIGASAGGLHALRRLVAGLPAGLPASVVVVMHLSPTSTRLPELLACCGRLPAAYAVSGQRLTPGMLTVAPPGRHLVVTAGDMLRLHHGPLVHRTRPAIDPLFHSVAQVCRDRVIAVVLSGLLYDGADGAAVVAEAGGAVLVQDPADARSRGMPRNTLARVPGAVVWPADKLGPAIADLVTSPAAAGRTTAGQVPTAESLGEALWLAIARLQAHAAVQQQLQHRLQQPGDTGTLGARAGDRAAEALRAAELITRHVLPVVAPDVTNP